MSKKKHFGILEEVVEKEIDSFDASNCGFSAKDKMLADHDFQFIPSEAFREISDYPEFGYLKKGLWVGKDRLRVDDTVQKTLKGLGIFSLNNHYVSNLNLYTSMSIANDLGGQLLSTSEYYCVYNHLFRNNVDHEMSINMGHMGAEWVSTMLSKNNHVIIPLEYTLNDIKDYRLMIDRNIPDSDILAFKLDDLDKRLGLPKHITHEGDFSFYSTARPGISAIHRDGVGPGLFCMNARNSPRDTDPRIGMRLCYKVMEDGR